MANTYTSRPLPPSPSLLSSLSSPFLAETLVVQSIVLGFMLAIKFSPCESFKTFNFSCRLICCDGDLYGATTDIKSSCIINWFTSSSKTKLQQVDIICFVSFDSYCRCHMTSYNPINELIFFFNKKVILTRFKLYKFFKTNLTIFITMLRINIKKKTKK